MRRIRIWIELNWGLDFSSNIPWKTVEVSLHHQFVSKRWWNRELANPIVKISAFWLFVQTNKLYFRVEKLTNEVVINFNMICLNLKNRWKGKDGGMWNSYSIEWIHIISAVVHESAWISACTWRGYNGLFLARPWNEISPKMPKSLLCDECHGKCIFDISKDSFYGL